MKRAAFSLVELSIVLVILGLLVGGVLSGQSLIRAAELRAITQEYSNYIAAVNSFKDKYFAMPGDMDSATKFWGRENGNADCVTNSAAAVSANGTCDGNGDGSIHQAGGLSQSGEEFQFWRQLALAGLIEGTYTGIAGPTAGSTGDDNVLGTNAPRSKMSNSGWSARAYNSFGDGYTYLHDFGNLMVFGGLKPGYFPLGPTLKPEEAWNIDTKIDDGKPGSGKMWMFDFIGFGSPSACTTSANDTDYTGSYNLGSATFACSIFFDHAF